MADDLGIIQALLREGREEQLKGNALLGDLRVAVAALQRSHDGQGAAISEMRLDTREMADRMREAELQMQGMPRREDIAALWSNSEKLDARVRILEGQGHESKLVHGALFGGAREIFRQLFGGLIGAAVALAAWALAARHGGPPG